MRAPPTESQLWRAAVQYVMRVGGLWRHHKPEASEIESQYRTWLKKRKREEKRGKVLPERNRLQSLSPLALGKHCPGYRGRVCSYWQRSTEVLVLWWYWQCTPGFDLVLARPITNAQHNGQHFTPPTQPTVQTTECRLDKNHCRKSFLSTCPIAEGRLLLWVAMHIEFALFHQYWRRHFCIW